jgi:aspartyl/asparaginyl beta-hydroxylase (cupin superfamily)
MNPNSTDHEGIARAAVRALAPFAIDDSPIAPSDRLKFVKELLSQGKIPRSLDPRRRPALFYPGLESCAMVYSPESFVWAGQVVEQIPRITDELRALVDSPKGFHTVWPEYTDDGEWAAFWLSLYGQVYEENARRCPNTISIVSAIPMQAGWCGFSAMAPNTHITSHCGFTNAKLRCHLPLVLPEHGCRMRIADTMHVWRAGQLLVFDDSYEHEVWNESDTKRVLLIFDIFHPSLNDDEIVWLSDFERQVIRPRYVKLMQDYASKSSAVNWLK